MMAEYVAWYHATCHAILLTNSISRLKVVKPISRQWNSIAIADLGCWFLKHHIFVREKVENQSILFKHINTDDMLADPLSKGLQSNTLVQPVFSMGLTRRLHY